MGPRQIGHEGATASWSLPLREERPSASRLSLQPSQRHLCPQGTTSIALGASWQMMQSLSTCGAGRVAPDGPAAPSDWSTGVSMRSMTSGPAGEASVARFRLGLRGDSGSASMLVEGSDRPRRALDVAVVLAGGACVILVGGEEIVVVVVVDDVRVVVARLGVGFDASRLGAVGPSRGRVGGRPRRGRARAASSATTRRLFVARVVVARVLVRARRGGERRDGERRQNLPVPRKAFLARHLVLRHAVRHGAVVTTPTRRRHRDAGSGSRARTRSRRPRCVFPARAFSTPVDGGEIAKVPSVVDIFVNAIPVHFVRDARPTVSRPGKAKLGFELSYSHSNQPGATCEAEFWVQAQASGAY